MATLFPHKDLENYFVTVDYRDVSQWPNVIKLYESGKVVLLSGAKIDFDRSFFDSIQFPKGQKSLKKFKAHRFLDEYAHGAVRPAPVAAPPCRTTPRTSR